MHLIAITVDNAKTNDVLIRTLSNLLVKKYDIQFIPGNAHICCLAHVVNLVMQKILSTLDEADNPDDNDYFEQFMKNLPIHYDPDKDEALKELENEDLLLDADSDEEDSDKDLFADPKPENLNGEEQILLKFSALKKVRTVIFFLIHVSLNMRHSCELLLQKLARLLNGAPSFETSLQKPTRTRRYRRRNLMLQTSWLSMT
jgi:hypothetical protein